MMDISLFIEMLSVDSTSGRERKLADFLSERLLTGANSVVRYDVESMNADVPQGYGMPQNLLFSWGTPRVVFCTHLDTVPPYIAPVSSLKQSQDSPVEEPLVSGRGTCDAKGQIFAMWEACKALESKGYRDFGLLLLAGEETGSYGAKAYSAMAEAMGAGVADNWVIVGEPTDNCMATAAKGTKAFEVKFRGEAFHSGYPQYGQSAVEMFNDFVNALRSIRFPNDDLLGDTTYNIGRLISDNPQNILSPELTCRVYFRTTFESDRMVCNVMKNMAGPDARLRFGRSVVQDGTDLATKDVAPWQRAMSVTALGGDSPTRFETFEGFAAKPVSFGSDAPQLTCFDHKILCGPDSILVAHRSDEHIFLKDIETAISNYTEIAERILNNRTL